MSLHVFCFDNVPKQNLGLKFSAWKVFGSNDFGLVALYHQTKLDLFGSKKFGSEKFWVFVFKKVFVSKKKVFGSKKILGPKNI